MKNIRKRIISILMVIMVMLSMTPTMAFDGAVTKSGSLNKTIEPKVVVNPIYKDIISQEDAEKWYEEKLEETKNKKT